MATKKKRTSPTKQRKKATKARGAVAGSPRKKASRRRDNTEDRERQRYQKLASRPEHAELFVFLDAMRKNDNDAADLFAAGKIDAALDAAGVKLTAEQRKRALETLKNLTPEDLSGVAELLRLPELIKVAFN